MNSSPVTNKTIVSPASILLWVMCLALAALFVLCAGVRRLNFDEALALKAGWLAVSNIPSAPNMLMPSTLLYSILGKLIFDPGTLFLTLRLLVSLSVLASLIFAYRRILRTRTQVALSICVVLLSGVFVAHALEFRYDWLILLPWILCFALLAEQHKQRPLLLGVLIGLLACHQLKGLVLALMVYVLSLVLIWLKPNRARCLLFLNLGLVFFTTLWVCFCVLAGYAESLEQTYLAFLDIAAQNRSWTYSSAIFQTGIAPDLLWWSLLILALLMKLLSGISYSERHRKTLLLAIFFTFAPLILAALHPHPWPYMLTIAIPSGAILITNLLNDAARQKRLWIIFLYAAVIAFAHHGYTGRNLLYPYAESLRASREPQVATLRYLRKHINSKDTILDPSGLSYFVPLSSKEWYVDLLFRQEIRKRKWLAHKQRASMKRADWVLMTYRLNMLPQDIRLFIFRNTRPVGNALRLKREDPRLPKLNATQLKTHAGLKSFWLGQ